MPDQTTAQFGTEQNMVNAPYASNNYYAQNMQNAAYSKDNIAENQGVLGGGNEQRVVTNPILEGGNNIQQSTQYHNVHQTSQLINPHQGGVATLGDTNNTYPINQQQNIIPQQHYPNMNQQFQSLNLNNEAASNAGAANVTPTQFSADLRVHPVGQNVYRDQNVASQVTTGANDPNVTWQQSNFTNMPSHNLNNIQSNTQNLQNTNNQNYLMSQNPSMTGQRQIPQQEIQNMSQESLSPNLYQKTAEPQIYPSQNIQQNTPIGYHNNIPQMAQVRSSNQLHSQPIQNISQQQMLPQPQQFGNYGHIPSYTSLQSVTNQHFNVERVQPSQQNIQLQQPSHSTANVPITYQQPHSLSSNAVQEQMIPRHTPCPQDASVPQATRPAYSARNVSNASNEQMSRHNIVAESSSAPNMSNVAQRNNARVTNGFEEGSRMKSKSHYNVPEQGINLNRSKGDLGPTYEEESLPYGYPPQFPNDAQDDDEKPLPSSKLERPRSLSIQKSEEETGDIAAHDKDCKNSETSVEPTNIESNMKTVKISDNADSENLPPSEANDVQSTKTPSHLTNQGYFDIKFYHNKLW